MIQRYFGSSTVFFQNMGCLGTSTYSLISKSMIKAFGVSMSMPKLWPPLSFAYFTDSINICSRISSVKTFLNHIVSESVLSTIGASNFQVNSLCESIPPGCQLSAQWLLVCPYFAAFGSHLSIFSLFFCSSSSPFVTRPDGV